MRVVATAAALTILTMLFGARAQGNRSLTDFESRKTDLEDTSSESEMNDVAALKEKLLLAQSTINALTDTAASLGSKSEVIHRELEEARLRLEAIGLKDMDGDPSRLEARLLQAIRELRVLKEKNASASEQLLLLSESIQVLMQTASGVNPQARMTVEAELRKTAEILGAPLVPQPDALNASLQDALVVDTKDELSMLIANVGKAHGVQLGMPFLILRDGRRIGSAKIIDVRERVSGAVIQNLTSDDVRVEKGDILKVDARQ
ncbi:MAG: hypothetical protein WCG52_11375 [bacterium]